MSTYYYLCQKCSYCGYQNDEVVYFDGDEIHDFICEDCGKTNLLVMYFKSMRVDEKAEDENE